MQWQNPAMILKRHPNDSLIKSHITEMGLKLYFRQLALTFLSAFGDKFIKCAKGSHVPNVLKMTWPKFMVNHHKKISRHNLSFNHHDHRHQHQHHNLKLTSENLSSKSLKTVVVSSTTIIIITIIMHYWGVLPIHGKNKKFEIQWVPYLIPFLLP